MDDRKYAVGEFVNRRQTAWEVISGVKNAREPGTVVWLTTFSFHDNFCTRYRRLTGARIIFLTPLGDHLGEK